MIPGVGIDLVSTLKTVKGLSERAIDDLTKYRVEHNPSLVAHAATCLREINEFFGDGKLSLMVTILDGISKRKPA